MKLDTISLDGVRRSSRIYPFQHVYDDIDVEAKFSRRAEGLPSEAERNDIADSVHRSEPTKTHHQCESIVAP